MTDDTPGLETWKEHTSAFDRVRSVAETVARPRSASYIATEAAVAENTARGHLERLVEMNVLLKSEHDGTTVYAPDPLHTRAQTLRELLTEYDHAGLVGLKEELQGQVERWLEQYDAGSPEELRALAAETDEAAETRAIRTAASEWELVRYRLNVVEDAIENYATYTRGDVVSA